MLHKGLNPGIRKIAAVLTGVMLVFINSPAMSIASNEVPEKVYEGDTNAAVMLRNLDYADVRNSNTWAKEAIYQTGALDVLKGFGNKQFGRTGVLSKEEAIALAYRAAGREADAQKAAEALDNARQNSDKNTNTLSMWSDGYLQLAAQDGLISRQDLNDAFSQDGTAAEDGGFNRKAPAQRQDIAFWIAKTLGLQPVYGQQEIFNSYNDWKEASPTKIPYIEAVLKNNIMNGDGNGNFKPVQSVTREQAAQIIKNADSLILPLLKMEKKTGTIEKINFASDFSNDTAIDKYTYDIRNSNGKLHRIITESTSDTSLSGRNEQNGKLVPALSRDLIVYKNGAVGDGSLLKEGDRIEYIVDEGSTVKYVRVISNREDVKYIAARIDSIDTGRTLMNVTQLFKLDSPDVESLSGNSFDMEGEQAGASYIYGGNLSVTVNGRKAGIEELEPGMDVILTIQNSSVVTAVKTADFVLNPDEKNISKGIVEDNNPELGFITLYNESGVGSRATGNGVLPAVRIFNYINPTEVEVFKNHEEAGIDEVEPGDTAYIRTDEEGNVLSISAVDNYTVKFGKVLSKKPATLAVEYDDGIQQVLDIDDSVLIISENRAVSYSGLKDGDRVKLILHITNKFTRLKEITIEGEEHLITSIYKGIISHIDDISNKVVALNLQVFEGGQWRKTDNKGFTDIKLADGYDMYFGSSKVDTGKVNRYFKGSEAYIAMESDYGGEENAVLISFRNEDDSEMLYDDSVINTVPGKGSFKLSSGKSSIMLDPGSIIIKDGRLVSGSSISNDDMAYVVANRSYDSGEYNAGIVQIKERSGLDFVQIYRGRINEINEGSDFTVQSFSQLDDLEWKYSNTPKTFSINNSTKIIDDEGVVGQRDFTSYGEDAYTGRTVYILSKDENAVLISTAPYGTYNFRGEVYDITGGSVGDEGTILEEPTGLILRKATSYDLSEHLWEDSEDMTLNILKNSIILKNNAVVKPSAIVKGDSIRVIKKDGSETGDAYIIIVES